MRVMLVVLVAACAPPAHGDVLRLRLGDLARIEDSGSGGYSHVKAHWLGPAMTAILLGVRAHRPALTQIREVTRGILREAGIDGAFEIESIHDLGGLHALEAIVRGYTATGRFQLHCWSARELGEHRNRTGCNLRLSGSSSAIEYVVSDPR